MTRRFFASIVLFAGLLTTNKAHAQAVPTATRGVQLSAFGGVAGVYTGVADGRNASIVLGGDIAFSVFHGTRPSVEVCGLFPIDSGSVLDQRSILFGPRVAFLPRRRFHPYGDFLFGRGEINYLHGGYIFGPFLYVQTTTNVFSPGFGLDYDLTPQISLKVDGQYQHWGYTPTSSGSAWSKVGTVGVVYRFNFGSRRLP